MVTGLEEHIQSGSTTLCRAWLVRRKDGVALGFTDHDATLQFEGVEYRAQSGLTARALQQSTGFAVDNSEALGALSEAAVREEDIALGRYDGAEVTCWLLNWASPDQRMVLFSGTFGEITRVQGAFRVELRGLTEQLNLPNGQVYHAACGAALGDSRCGVNLAAAGMFAEVAVQAIVDGQIAVPALPEFAPGWFEGGRLRVLTGVGSAQRATIRRDQTGAGQRLLALWAGLSVLPEPGDMLRLEAGCDKRGSTCRDKFANYLNFRGFPHIPGEDWLLANPQSAIRG